MEKVKHKKENDVIVPKIFRRDVRKRKAHFRGYKLRNDGSEHGVGKYFTMRVIYGSPIYLPKKKKLKGYQKNHR